MNKRNDFALVPRPPSEIEKAEPGAKRVLSGMVADTLALVRTHLPQKPTFTTLVGLDIFGPLTALILAQKLAETHNLVFFYFARSSELLKLVEDHPFDLISLYVGNIIWDAGPKDGSFRGAAGVLGSVKARYGKPIVATQGLDLSAELESKGVIFLEAPYQIKDFWTRLGPQLSTPAKVDSTKKTFSLAVCGLNPDHDFLTAFFTFPLQGILGSGYAVTLNYFPYALWEGTFDGHDVLAWHDLVVIFLNPVLNSSQNKGEVDVPDLIAKLKAKSQRPVIVLTNEGNYGLDCAATFQKVGADAFLSFLPPFPAELFRQTLKDCVAKSMASRQPLRIVILDDEEGPRQWHLAVLKDMYEGQEILDFEDSYAAWQELLRADPDLFITDIRHVGISGIEMLTRLAERKVKYPIMVVSATLDSYEEDVRRGWGPGLNVSFLEKPVDIEKYRAVVEAALHIPARQNHER